jgi:hypothetical protein
MSADRPLVLPSLSFAGQLLVWSGRQWVGRAADWQAVEAEFSGPFGPRDARDLAGALGGLFTLLNLAARRPMIFGPPNCRRVWRDEALIVRLVQLEQHNRSAWAFTLLEGVLPRAAAREAAGFVATIAHVLDRAGYDVTLADADVDAADAALDRRPAAEGAKITIH